MKKIQVLCPSCNFIFYRNEDGFTLDWKTKCPKCECWDCEPTGVLESLDFFLNYKEEQIEEHFYNYSKQELIDFAENFEIPYKKHFSRVKLYTEICDFVNMSMIFKRIGER